MMMDDSAPIHERRKLVKTYKNAFPQIRTVVAEVSGETYSKKYDKNGVEKRPHTQLPRKLKIRSEKERERWIILSLYGDKGGTR